jgi:hypothetical protein
MKVLLGRKTSPEFRALFSQARQACARPVMFFDAQKLPQNDPFRNHKGRTVATSETVQIYLDGALESPLLEMVAGHELSHLVLEHEGYPQSAWNKSASSTNAVVHRRMAVYVVNCLADPIITRRLDERGFPATAALCQDLDACIPGLQSMAAREPSEGEFHFGAFKYLNMKLTIPADRLEEYAALLAEKAESAFTWGERLADIALANNYESCDGNWRACVEIFETLGLCHVGLTAHGRWHAPRW